MKNQTIVLLLILISLCFGVSIYATTRTDSLFLNQFIVPFGGHYLALVRSFIGGLSFPHWVMFSLPDALWMLALNLLILMIWNFQLDKKSMPWLITATGAGLLFEIGQGIHLIRGTFDIADLLSIFVGASIPIMYIVLKPRVWTLK